MTVEQCNQCKYQTRASPGVPICKFGYFRARYTNEQCKRFKAKSRKFSRWPSKEGDKKKS